MREAEQAGRTGAGDDRDLVQRVLAGDAVGQGAPGQKLGIDPLELVVAHGAVHEERDELRVRERFGAGAVEPIKGCFP